MIFSQKILGVTHWTVSLDYLLTPIEVQHMVQGSTKFCTLMCLNQEPKYTAQYIF